MGKPGWKSTEFWVVVVSPIVVVVLARLGFSDIAAALLQGLSAAGYSVGRSLVKRGGGGPRAPIGGAAAIALAVLTIGSLASCTPTQLYVRADRSIYSAIAPEYRGYVASDSKLSAVQKARRERTLTEWRKMIEAAEAASKAEVIR